MNDTCMVRASNLTEIFMGEFSERLQRGDQYCVYGDQGYMATPFVLAGKKGARGLDVKLKRAWDASLVLSLPSLDGFRMRRRSSVSWLSSVWCACF